MSLPGKLCIGILEEDNPLKSYFRFKPLLVAQGDRYAPYTDAQAYPQDGCIRIVPDKNESYHFKARMRHIGLFAVVDLRAHPEDNDKIRPNKNFRQDGPEQNAYIIYSDVVREPAPETILEILPEGDLQAPRPHPRTASVLLKGDALRPERYAWEPIPDSQDQVRLLPTDRLCPPEDVQVFELDGFRKETLSFAILPPTAPTRPGEASASRPSRPAAPLTPAPAAPAMDAAPATPAPAPSPEASEKPAAAPTPEKPGESAPAPTAEAPATPGTQTVPEASPAPEEQAAAPEAPASPAPPAAEPPAEKPWLHRDRSILPRPVDPRLSPAERSLAVQSGMNPRRGRSLQELIDEKWQHSRLNQLGQEVASVQTGAPVTSPVDAAVDAVREVWNQPQLRKGLLESLSGIEEFGASLEECRQVARQMDIEQHLNGLEARRLALLSELDHLSRKSADMRESLKREIRRDEAGSLAEAVERTKAARAEQEKFERLAAEARDAARDARQAVERLTGEELERQLTQFVLNEHMLERMRALKGEAEAIPPKPPTLQTIDLKALAIRVMNRFDASGFAITRAAALNLCACAAAGSTLILSGPVGSGKTRTARLLAEALGWAPAQRLLEFSPGKGSLERSKRLAELARLPETPALLLLDDANLYPTADPLRGLDRNLAPQWRLCLTVQDDGFPLSAHALDRGFTLRLNPSPGAPWRPAARAACQPEAPAALNLAIPDAPLPAAAEARLDALRTALARRGAAISRRALDESWRYCALMLSALEDADPLAVLDRAVAQRILPALLASAPASALIDLPALLENLPQSRALLQSPLPVAVI